MDLSSAFAARILAVRSERDGASAKQLERLLLDFFGCALGGLRQPAVRALLNWAKRFDGTGVSTVIGTTLRVAPQIAALVNGTAAHSYELDDTHDATLSHPACVVIPAALAIAEETGASGADLLAAIVAGYEAMTRIGRAANAGRVIEFGFHPTALFGPFGAATAAARLQNVGIDKLLSAWGHALSLTGGSMQFSDDADGAEIKRLHAGYAALHGVMAMELADGNIGAPRRALDGKYGFLHLYGKTPRSEELLSDQLPPAILAISFKPYACCRQFHAVIDGIIKAMEGYAPGDIAGPIRVRGPRVLAAQHMIMRPGTSMAAQYSLPFVIGATIAFGPTNFMAFEPENLAHDGILALADRVEVGHDADLESQYPTHFGAEVEVTFTDGSTRVERILDSVGTPANPLSDAQLRLKAIGLAENAGVSIDINRLERKIASLTGSPDITALMQAVSRELH